MLKLTKFQLKSIGRVLSVADGIIKIDGLQQVGYGEVVIISTKNGEIQALVLNLDQEYVSAIVLASEVGIKPFDFVILQGF